MTSFAVIIPARYDSSRLPGKPLIKLAGVPMLVRTYRQVTQAVSDDLVYVATDSEAVRALCDAHGMKVIMTSSACLTGTDRVAECMRVLPKVDVLINVQGDEPLFNPLDLTRLIDTALRYPTEVVNGYCTIDSEHQFRSGNIPKVVLRPDGRLLYMSRAAIPTGKALGYAWGYRQVCAYAFPVHALKQFSACTEKTPLEHVEDIEILRFLELGFEVRMIQLSADSISVDIPSDVARVEKAILMKLST